MDDLKNNKMLWVVIAFTVLNLGLFFGSKIVVDKAADRVIEKLQKEYSPSPYGPGLDPDKVDPESLNIKTQNVVWRQEWEENRGFSPDFDYR
jgi:hypothetical protein